MSSVEDDRSADQAVETVHQLLTEARPTRAEQRTAERLDRILGDPASRDALMTLTDDVLRITDPNHALARMSSVVGGGLAGFGRTDRSALRLADTLARHLPSVGRRILKRIVDARIVAETHGVILPAETSGNRLGRDLGRSLARLADQGFATNINLLGESILGDREAQDRLDRVCDTLLRPDTGYVSVKISALCANLDVLAFDHSVDRIADRLRVLYRVALSRTPVGFVNLDMEEYRDLALTISAFTRVLSEPEFSSLEAGIVLQAYLPDTVRALDDLAAWATERRNLGGAGIKVRLVKGANLAMEQVEAELHGWEQAPYTSKAAVDANLKRLVERALDPKLDGALRIGLGSHNLFDIGWAADLADQLGHRHRLELEMLAGMAPAQARAVNNRLGRVRVYAPVVERSAMDAAISYLARRLDENAAPQNFLRNLLRIQPGSATFAAEEARFRAATAGRHRLSSEPRRTQDRTQPLSRANEQADFVNTPDTDFTIPANRGWIADALATISVQPIDSVSRVNQIDGVVSLAGATCGWGTLIERREMLASLAHLMERERGDTLALMAKTAAKTVREGDPEVSEAIDAVRFAATAGIDTLRNLVADGLDVRPAGTVVIAAPWNFPYAIPSLSLASALAAGCSVIVKPAPETSAVGAHLVDQCHRAGLPHGAVQLVVCDDGPVGTHLVTHPDVARVVLTGASATAASFLAADPHMGLLAETSGKNAMVITNAADLDQAIAALTRSAFGHAGQKCSAASLAILVGTLASDDSFLSRLADSTTSLTVGPADELSTVIGPLIAAPSANLRRALCTLDPGERWLVQPRCLTTDETQWTPGIRLGVQPGSWFHLTECFGPVLGIMTAPDLDSATEMQNATGYGLTGGLQSLDPTEIQQWLRTVEVGNAYVNRQMTGAIVGRQPFGGWKQSSVGGSAKPGGPDHQLMFASVTAPAVPDRDVAKASYRTAWETIYSVDVDMSGLSCEHNVLRHHPLTGVVLWHVPDDPRIELLLDAARITCTPVHLVTTAPAALACIGTGQVERIRLLADCPQTVLQAAHSAGVAIDRTPVTGHGRVELGRWMREQSISVTAHRHGRLLTTMAAPITCSRR